MFFLLLDFLSFSLKPSFKEASIELDSGRSGTVCDLMAWHFYCILSSLKVNGMWDGRGAVQIVKDEKSYFILCLLTNQVSFYHYLQIDLE